jgi:hypothetical protein
LSSEKEKLLRSTDYRTLLCLAEKAAGPCIKKGPTREMLSGIVKEFFSVDEIIMIARAEDEGMAEGGFGFGWREGQAA